ncbi:hypothetical protein [Streptomyces sp. NBC_01373]|uniref:hypothetical protein n=1 Tax=Streptomyces sp. NBC_01373 TaxID=2903843 RepID=UPI00224CF71E|nr:hypothetical protein [Streptomyces sp. NBC_01373]MCX4698752.1 hypothetical protein [Streptomyces sp. NBC_01373]
MHSEPAIENRAAAVVRGRRRKRGNGSPTEGPVFVDNSGRRSKALRRIGLLVGVVCLGYAVVLGMAFMGVGISVNPSALVPFGGGGGSGAGPGGTGPGGYQPQGGIGDRGVRPSGAPSALPSVSPSVTAAPSAAS